MKIMQDCYDDNLYIDVVLTPEETQDLQDSYVLAVPLKVGDRVVSIGVRMDKEESYAPTERLLAKSG